MPFKINSSPGVKIKWTDEMISFLQDNYESMTNKQLADALGIRITSARTKLYQLGLKRMEMEYWTEEQTIYLLANYKKIGDVELAEIFNAMFPKNKKWTKKHIEKKRRYLKLSRTPDQQYAIKERNRLAGRFSRNHYKRWLGREAKLGTLKVWHNYDRPFLMIKVAAGWMKLAHYNWIKRNGKIPANRLIIHKDGNPMNCSIKNLACVTRAEHGANSRNIEKDYYIATIMSYGNKKLRKEIFKNKPLIELKRAQLKQRRAIDNEKRKHRTAS